MERDIHPGFRYFLDFKSQDLINLYTELRMYILSKNPDSNELLYNTHALTSLYSVSKKMSAGFCMIVVYKNHMNLAFNSATLLPDPKQLFQGTGKMMRHIPIKSTSDFMNDDVDALIDAAIELALEDLGLPQKEKSQVISKIKV